MDNRTAFIKAVKGCLSQNVKSHHQEVGGPTNICLLFGPNGTKCAIGHLIPKDLYIPEMEDSTSVLMLIREFAEIRNLFASVSTELLMNLQDVHDLYDPCSWNQEFKIVGKKFNLQDTFLEVFGEA